MWSNDFVRIVPFANTIIQREALFLWWRRFASAPSIARLMPSTKYIWNEMQLFWLTNRIIKLGSSWILTFHRVEPKSYFGCLIAPGNCASGFPSLEVPFEDVECLPQERYAVNLISMHGFRFELVHLANVSFLTRASAQLGDIFPIDPEKDGYHRKFVSLFVQLQLVELGTLIRYELLWHTKKFTRCANHKLTIKHETPN